MEDTPSEMPQADALLLSNDERRALELYDKLQQLQLEIALITAQKNYVANNSTARGAETAQNDLLQARARYVLRNEVTESVVMANPVLQAIHGGINASPIERDLLPVLDQRDSAAVSMAHQSTSLRQTMEQIIDVETQSMRLSRQNVDLAAEVLELAEEANKQKDAPVDDPEQAEEIAQLEDEVKSSRQRWRVMKATASAIIAGSGVNWAADPELKSIVLDEDDDGV
ncbi:putative Centromere protein H (CENP-H)-domain-containing protein [Seiridium cardinale]|uniref:Centromere protein H (CENP-H)-domain-containing protein n=1 Tax=Seiridium cardinale TaxID=138064 RepID=A0ABR2Y4C4_9PEZI